MTSPDMVNTSGHHLPLFPPISWLHIQDVFFADWTVYWEFWRIIRAVQNCNILSEKSTFKLTLTAMRKFTHNPELYDIQNILVQYFIYWTKKLPSYAKLCFLVENIQGVWKSHPLSSNFDRLGVENKLWNSCWGVQPPPPP